MKEGYSEGLKTGGMPFVFVRYRPEESSPRRNDEGENGFLLLR